MHAQWLKAAALSTNDGLVSVSSCMLGVSTVNQSVKATVVSGLASLIAGALRIAIGEYISVYSQVDIELAQMKRERLLRQRLVCSERKVDRLSTYAAIFPLLLLSFVVPARSPPLYVCKRRHADEEKEQKKKEKLPSPLQAAGASALAFGIGAAVLLLVGAFIKQ
ncbi:vacuolar iron transporter homolog 1-like [Nymphaea colorata]|nr:vacuolar iron transporter homolog 1-like [Nymphaea colorata]